MITFPIFALFCGTLWVVRILKFELWGDEEHGHGR